MSSDKPTLPIDITSDTTCPWCFIGFQRLQRAIASPEVQKLNVNIEVRFRPPRPKRSRYDAKFGIAGDQHTDATQLRIALAAEEEGIQFRWGGLLEKAWEKGGSGLQVKFAEIVCKGYNEEEQDVSSHAYLASAAESARVFSESEALEWLKGDDCLRDVQQGFLRAKSYGVDSVPYIVIDNRAAVTGVEDIGLFIKEIQLCAENPTPY